jgi:hypothetical protein
MADLVSDGKIRVVWAPSVANIAAPTVAETNAGLRLDNVMTPDGLKIAWKTADVDTSALSSTYDTSRAGRRGVDVSVEIKRQDTGDTALTTLVYRAVGFLLVRRTVDAGTAPTAAQVWEVYPGECKQGSDTYGPNKIQTRTIEIGVTSDPNAAAVMA